MDLSNLKPRIPNKKTRRLGRGTGSGRGKTAGKGHKGAGQRKGKKNPYAGHRGGNIPYIRKIPKRGFTSMHRKQYQIVNLCDIQKRLDKLSEINPESLQENNLIKDKRNPVKILAKINDDFNLKVMIKADKFSQKARDLIEKAGGKAECLSR
ncbi:MAG: 50S ribosomal protein L15 [Candidatus Omnitrophica bacterium]|nr:50S ribosomal protein L15 [Candidatus Omnitrophota bacterium]